MNEILREVIEAGKQMEKLIAKSNFRVGDAQNFLKRWYNIIRSLEDMTSSRDLWKKRALKAEAREKVN